MAIGASNGEHLLGERAELLGGLRAVFAFGFVDGLDERIPLILGSRPWKVHEIGPELAVAQAHDEILFGQAESAEHVDDQRDQFDVGFEPGLADDASVAGS